MDAPPGLTRHQEAVAGYLRSLLQKQSPGLLYRMLRYHMGWEEPDGQPSAAGGKTVRPGLCLLAAEAAGGRPERALAAAAAVELVHNFSLIHDDVQDRDLERRHRPTVWAVWGDAQAINAGDAMLSLARLSLLDLLKAGVPPESVVEAAQVLDRSTLEMVEGQTLDISFETEEYVGLAAYLEMAEKKTGALMGCALKLGALTAAAPQSVLEALERCGRQIGVAFQVRDDILGVWGAKSRTGKAAGADIRRRKKSLPVVYLLGQPQAAALREAYVKAEVGEEEVASIFQALESSGAREYCEGVVRKYRDAAIEVLDALPLEPGPAADLRQVVNFLAEREY